MSEEQRDPANPHPGMEVIEVDIEKVYRVDGQLNLSAPLRAQIALDSNKTEATLRELVTKHQSIKEIKDKAGRDQAHGAAMELMRTRTNIADLSKKARDDATKFSRAVIAEEQRLVAIIEPEEKRLKGLRDAWDEEQERIKREKAEAERKRLLAIANQINDIKAFTALAAQCRTSARIQELIDRLTAVEISPEVYAEFVDEAAAAKSIALNQMGAALKAKQEQEAEAARLAAERAALEEQRRQQEAQARALAEQQAEIERQRKALEAASKPAEPPPVEPSTAQNNHPVSESGIAAVAKCDGNHGGEVCTDPECWQRSVRDPNHPMPKGTPPAPHGFLDLEPPALPVPANRPSDDEIIDALCLHFRVHESKVIEWLQEIDLAAANARLATEFA